MKVFNKNIAKEFRTGFARFIAIMAIIALGVGFLIGIIQATPDMKNTMDKFYKEQRASDVTIKASYGLTQEDLQEIEGSECVEAATAVISTDTAILAEGKEMIGRVIGLDIDGEPLNQLTLVSGRMPERGKKEVLALQPSNAFEKIKVGTVIQIDSDDSVYGDVYVQTEYEVVGIVSSPDYYYTDGRETTSLGSGKIGTVLYGYTEELYDLQKSGTIFSYLSNEFILGEKAITIVATDCWVKITGADDYRHFYDDYKDYVLEESSALETLGEQCSERVNEAIEVLRGFAQSAGMTMNLAPAQWYVLDRAGTNVSYASFALNVEKVEDIAGIFPVFFILVAALVALTSMTRMVEEDRMQIGTFKALGYGRGKIMRKYLVYCCFASIIGCLVGILCGFALLPSVFWRAYSTMYQLPELRLGFSWIFAIAVFAISILGTIIVTWGACRNSLKERPASLMQPKAPKPGKRILLERIGILWKPLKFKWKATIRNIFRYKKNMFLTIVSVMGCTALILTGFGLSDSVDAVTELQFSKVIKYNALIEYTGELPQTGALREFIGTTEEEGERYISVYKESVRVIFGENGADGNETADLYVVEDGAQFNAFVDLHERKNSAIINITEEEQGGVVLPENLAIVYGVQAGDTVYISHSGMRMAECKVLAICENYTGSYVYVSRSTYEDLWGEKPDDNTVLVKSDIDEAEAEEQTKKILAENGSSNVEVQSISFTYETENSFASLSSTMGLVIAILVISAGALAAIVLYNLTNINIDERRREIATLRVLGYRKLEVAGYIYRESAILTVVGTLLGLVLGIFLHMFIVNRVNSVTMMFGSSIAGLSYLWAFLLTLAFAVIVYAFMLIKLNKINMAESLKSNE